MYGEAVCAGWAAYKTVYLQCSFDSSGRLTASKGVVVRLRRVRSSPHRAISPNA
jgi:hypothetical protein